MIQISGIEITEIDFEKIRLLIYNPCKKKIMYIGKPKQKMLKAGMIELYEIQALNEPVYTLTEQFMDDARVYLEFLQL